MLRLFLVLLLTIFSFYTLTDEKPLGKFLGAKLVEEHPSWFKQSFLELEDDIAESKDNNKHLILYIGQDGCPYCAKLIEDNFHNPKLVAKIRKSFEVIAINMWGDREVISLDGETYSEKEFAAKLKVQFTPTLLFFDLTGNVVLRLNGYQNPEKMLKALSYVENIKYKEISFAKFIETKQQSGKEITRLNYAIKPPYILTRNQKTPSDKYLAVLFEKSNCPECLEFKENMLSKNNIKSLITQMEVVQLDITKDNLITPNGKKTSANNWYQKLNLTYLPALVIFDKNGIEVIRKDAFFKEFHFESILDYAITGGYKTEPSFQRYIEHKADKIRESGRDVDIWRD